MITEKMATAFNNQITAEMYSSNLYLSMVAYFEELGLKGFSNWMRVQVQEETAHAMGLFDYLLSRDGKALIGAIDKPPYEWSSVLDCFEAIYQHEQLVTSLINKLIDVAEEEKDRAAISVLQCGHASEISWNMHSVCLPHSTTVRSHSRNFRAWCIR